MNGIVVPPRFARQIRLHLVGNFLDLALSPVICGIFGRAGDGKSAQLAVCLAHAETQVYRINASDLESGLAGEPGKLIARTYAAASLGVAKSKPAALVIEDVDTTVGEWEQNTGTVNHQQVLAELMHIADRPVDHERNSPARVPIFVTGNNLGRLYPPLRRPGRMVVFGWRPTVDELHGVVSRIFAEVAAPQVIDALVREFRDEPVAFFAEVRRRLHTEAAAALLGDLPRDMCEVLQMKARMRELLDRGSPADGYEVLRAAKEVRDDRELASRDFLDGTARGGRR
ncbi:AAA family ATPase [Phytohabitans sp. ZYX-F-186]|uniref:AAA family ATPase n=1 Tax=Phytohabitans maris TaxID=3071409 RepID=A0ABU0ZKS2_9ACTN|nr:AAA family ATPase [Phytohabitans sp. ZYX-F-186]MDQ7907646.1 AAA family ATPase [Phytohabitans sp. ZYX-F-186]